MDRRDQGLEGHAAASPAARLQCRTWPLLSVLPGLGWAACPSGSAPARRLIQGQWVMAGAGSRHVSRPAGLDGARSPCARAAQDPRAPGLACSLSAGGVHITSACGMSMLSLSPWAPCMYGVQGAGEPAPQTTAVQGRPRETSRRKEPPGLQPPQEPPCRAHSRWPQVPPQRERRRPLGPGTRGGCVPTAPAAFQEQYCWHQAGSLRRQRIHGPFMRGAGMIYCLGEGAGVGGWSSSMPAPARPAPHACSLPQGLAHVSEAEGLARGVTSPLLGMGQSGSCCPICTMPAHSLPHLWDPGDALPSWAPCCD